MNIEKIETELKKRAEYPYVWGTIQADNKDKASNFIYHTPSFGDLLVKINETCKPNWNYEDFYNYTLNRWYNFWSAMAVEQIFCSLPNVKPNTNKKDRLIDFAIQGITFDHKTSIFPKGYNYSLEYAQKSPKSLIIWLYNHQSPNSQRVHFNNRLFIIVENWKLKAEIKLLKKAIEKYVNNFKPEKLYELDYVKFRKTLSDIIWVINKPIPDTPPVTEQKQMSLW